MDKIQKAWEEYHGEPIDDGFGNTHYPKAPPSFIRGYVDGCEEGKKEASRLREKLDDVKKEIWGDDYNEYSDDNLSSVIESIANR